MYEARQAQLDHDIETANVELDKSRVILQAARQEKKQKLQYEVVLAVDACSSHVQLTEAKDAHRCYRRKEKSVCNSQSGPKLKQRLLQSTRKLRHCRQKRSRQCRSMR